MTVYLVVLKNSNITKRLNIKLSYATLQLFLFDRTEWGAQTSTPESAPVMVIIIAVVVGGLISSFCIGVIVYIIMRSIKNRKKSHPEEKTELFEEQMRDKEGGRSQH